MTDLEQQDAYVEDSDERTSTIEGEDQVFSKECISEEEATDRESDLDQGHVSSEQLDTKLISDVTIGLSDGLTVPFALTAGLSALGDTKVVIFGGMAELIAGAISMGIGGYLGVKGEAYDRPISSITTSGNLGELTRLDQQRGLPSNSHQRPYSCQIVSLQN